MSKKFKFQKDLTERQRKTFSERLLKLGDLLSETPRKNYDHSSFVKTFKGLNKPAHECGTVACAGGHAATRKDLFPTLNLKFRRYLTNVHFQLVVARGKNASSAWSFDVFDELDNYFGQGSSDAIFSTEAFPSGNPSSATVAKRIVKFVRESFGYERA